MIEKKKILAISGSTRKNSSNLNLIRAIESLTKEIFVIKIFDGLSEIPSFNPDNDYENPPIQVIEFRRQLRESDGVLICTPEYAMGVPGSLKNAIDWTVSSCEFSHKPTALITASSLGQKGHASLLETLKIIETRVTDQTQLVISYIKTKVNNDCKIIDSKIFAEIEALIKAFDKLLRSD